MNDVVKDTTLKVNADIKDVVNQIGVDLGGRTQREVVEYLIGLHRVKEGQEEGRSIPSLDKLHHHFRRIEDVYAEWVRTTWDQEEKHAAERTGLQAELTQAKQTIFELREQLECTAQESATKVQAAQAEVQSAKERLAREQEEMSQRLTQAEAAQEQASQLAKFAQTAAEEAGRRAAALEERVQETNELTRQLGDALTHLEATEKELARAKERMPIELERATLQVERQYMTRVGELREALAAMREENAQLQIQLAKS